VGAIPSPFATPPHPIARAAAESLLAELRAGLAGDEGKMFGVLVAEAPDGTRVVLRAFSGMLGGAWTQPGFAPPLFDPAAWEAMWPAGQASLRAHERALRAIAEDPARAARRAELARLEGEKAAASEALRVLHRERKAARRIAREAGGLDAAGLHALEQESRADTAERRRFDAAWRASVSLRFNRRRGDAEQRTVSGPLAQAEYDNPSARAIDEDAVPSAAQPRRASPLLRDSPSPVKFSGTEATGTEAERGSEPLYRPATGHAADAAAYVALAAQVAADEAERGSEPLYRPATGHAEAYVALAARVAADEAERAAIEARRAEESRALMKQVHDSYVIESFRGERRALRDLFAPGEPPGGAGDCAGPKLLGEAYRRGLRPIAMAEAWWGPPPVTGGRHEGGFYPACRGKCGPILPFMLEGLEVEAAPVFGARAIAEDEPRPVFEDDDLVIVDKPIDLLSVPGRSGALRDSVQTRLRARYPGATGPLVVHRLDLETSGLLLAAKSDEMYALLQAQFARREIDKRYIAWLDGDVRGDGGVIELALRVDLDDRPRQIVDAAHGKAAITEWTVLARAGGRTRVAFVPRTGRTHQLRVHAAVGLGTPIVGDRLYGTAAERLMLHAERLAFVHPRTGQRIAVEAPAPW